MYLKSVYTQVVSLLINVTVICYLIHARLLRSSSNFQLYTPTPHLEIYRTTFVFSGSSVWNSLPSYIHNSNSVHHLKPCIYVG